MMKLSLLKNIITNTVDKNGNCVLANQLLTDWADNPQDVKFLRGSANFICIYSQNNRKYALRFNHTQERNIANWEDELEIVSILNSNKISTVKNIQSLNGNKVEMKKSVHGKIISTAFEWIDGSVLEIDNLSDNEFYLWGKALGELHSGFKVISQSLNRNRKQHEDLLQQYSSIAHRCTDHIREEFSWASNWLVELARNENNYGLIHYDFELDNIIWQKQEPVIIDFDDMIRSWYVADIAYALRDLFDQGLCYQPDNLQFQSFLSGYRSEFDIADKQLVLIPEFYRVHQLISYLRITRTLDIQSNENNPKWIEHITSKLESYRKSYYPRKSKLI